MEDIEKPTKSLVQMHTFSDSNLSEEDSDNARKSRCHKFSKIGGAVLLISILVAMFIYLYSSFGGGTVVHTGLAKDISANSQDIMHQKEHGTCVKSPPNLLRFDVDWKMADKICCYNRHFAEYFGSWSNYLTRSVFKSEMNSTNGEMIFFDTITYFRLY